MTELDEKFESLKPLQEKECEIIQYMDEFCEQYGIEYCLAYGSVLGAIRHGGPIPWDDDVDLYMTAWDYEKFRNLFREYGDHERFYLQERTMGGVRVAVPKLRMNGTTYIQESIKDTDMHHGIYADIFLLDNCPPTVWARKKAVAANAYMLLKKLSNDHYCKRKAVAPLMWVLRLFPKSFGLKYAADQLRKWNDREPSEMLADWGLYNGTQKWYLPKEIMFPTRKVSYLGHQVRVPADAERYLEIAYGDWRKIPNQDQISWAHHASLWSTTKDFREFCPNVKTFADEHI